MRTLLVACMILVAGVATAAPTTVTDTANNSSDPPTASWFLPSGGSPGFFPPWYRYYGQDWGWDHAVSYGAPPVPGATLQLLSATLTVHAWGVAGPDPITADSTLLGTLVYQPPGTQTWTTTTFNLAAILGDLTDGALDVDMAIDTAMSGSGVLLDWAKLGVTYDWLLPPPPPPPPSRIPAPGAVALAGIGTALIGWLRRRQSL